MKKLSIKVGLLLDALKVVAPAIDGKTVVPVMDNVLMEVNPETIHFTGHNLNVGIVLKISNALPAGAQPFNMLVEFKTLRNLLSGLPNTAEVELELENDGKAVSIRCGKTRFQLANDDVPDYARPKAATGPEVQVTEDAWKGMLRAAQVAKRENVGEALENVCLEVENGQTVRVVGCDGHIIYLHDYEAQTNPAQILVPQSLLRAAKGLKADSVTLSADDNRITAVMGDVTVTALCTTGKFPDVNPLFSERNKKECAQVSVSAVELAEGIRTIMAVTPDVTRSIYIEPQPGELKVRTANIDLSKQGCTTVTCSAQNAQVGEIKYNAMVLLLMLDVFVDAGVDHVTLFMKPMAGTTFITETAPIKAIVMPLAQD